MQVWWQIALSAHPQHWEAVGRGEDCTELEGPSHLSWGPSVGIDFDLPGWAEFLYENFLLLNLGSI